MRKRSSISAWALTPTLALFLLVSGVVRPATNVSAAAQVFPGPGWSRYAAPEEAGFSSERLAQARQYSEEIGSAAVMVVYRGAVLTHWGPIEKRFMCHSIRKSYLSALYGIHAAEGTIRLDQTLGELGVDDVNPLTDLEKQASIRDLLQARSGVYLPAAYETPAMTKARPKRGSHAPGTHFYYNNWDFNALGTILDRQTKSTIFKEFEGRIARPLQMQDFRAKDGYYHLEKEHSIHPAYPFRMSTRDMARFGLLYLRQGIWREKQVLTRSWVRESTRPYSIVDTNQGYAYLWWTVESEPFKSLGTYAARGFGGHSITVVPGGDLVFVHRVDTWWDLGIGPCPKGAVQKVGNANRLKLLGMILDARVAEAKPTPALIPMPELPARSGIRPPDPSILNSVIGNFEFGEGYRAAITMEDDRLQFTSSRAGTFTLLPLDEHAFLIEDLDAPVTFIRGNDGKPVAMAMELAPGEPCYGRPLPGVDGGSRKTLQSLTNTLDTLTPKLMAERKVPGVSVAVIWNGHLAWERGYGVIRAGERDRVTPATVFEACSMSKVALTYVVLKLAEQGRIDLDTALVDYLDHPYLTNAPRHRLITARMVMSHTTGFPNWRKGGWSSGGPLEIQFEPGTRYGYSGEGFLYLQRVVEQITGNSLQSLMQKMLFDPLAMDSSSFVWEERFDHLASAGHDGTGRVKASRPLYRQANAAYSMYTTPGDYARFIVEVMKLDRSAPHSLNADSIRRMFTSFVPISGSDGNPVLRTGTSAYESVGRGLGWVVGRTLDGDLRAWHSGSNGSGFRCHAEFNPRQRNGIVIMTGSVNGAPLCRALVRLCDFP